MATEEPRRHFWWLALLLVCGIALALVTRSGTPASVAPGTQADRIVVEKRAHTLTLFRHGQVLKSYRVALGRGGPGPKVQAGDNRVPEGLYRIVGRNAHSSFHRALRVGYPTPADIHQAQLRAVDPGGDIMVHGIRNGLGWLGPLQRNIDWTKGCVAVTDQEIEEIWNLVPDGTVIEIRS